MAKIEKAPGNHCVGYQGLFYIGHIYYIMAGNTARFIHLTPDDLYWLGWMASDGCLWWTNGWNIGLKLKAIDRACVERFAVFMGIESAKPANKGKAWKAELRSNILGARLTSYGITERKSKTLVVSSELARSPQFWRGVFEGDGCYHLQQNRYPIITISSGSTKFLEQLRSAYPNVFSPVFPFTRCFGTRITNFGDSRRFLNWIYQGATSETILERKYLKLSWLLAQKVTF